MKIADLKPMTLYGYKPGKYDALRPVLLVAPTYYRRPYQSENLDRMVVSIAELKAKNPRLGGGRYSGGDGHPKEGLLGVDCGSIRAWGGKDHTAEIEAAAKRLKRVIQRGSLTEEKLAAANRRAKVISPLRLHFLNPSWIKGEWDEVYGEKLDEDERRRDVNRLAAEESAARVAATQERVDRLRALALPGTIADAKESAAHNYGGEWRPARYSGNTGRVVLSLAQLDALLSLVPAGAKWEPDDVEEDGWTLRRPEYEEDGDDHTDD